MPKTPSPPHPPVTKTALSTLKMMGTVTGKAQTGCEEERPPLRASNAQKRALREASSVLRYAGLSGAGRVPLPESSFSFPYKRHLPKHIKRQTLRPVAQSEPTPRHTPSAGSCARCPHGCGTRPPHLRCSCDSAGNVLTHGTRVSHRTRLPSGPEHVQVWCSFDGESSSL